MGKVDKTLFLLRHDDDILNALVMYSYALGSFRMYMHVDGLLL
jgi:hypothetical protein